MSRVWLSDASSSRYGHRRGRSELRPSAAAAASITHGGSQSVSMFDLLPYASSAENFWLKRPFAIFF